MFMKRIISFSLSFFILFQGVVFAEESKKDAPVCESYILMEQTTGKVLDEYEADKKLNIASVTKTMTMLLVMEALESKKIKYSDMVETSAHAASMGGSQVFLEEGEKMSVHDMLKAIVISSGNDAAVAMAEHISGTEEAFVDLMNKRAGEIGAKNTHFINCNGLNETEEHYSTARDVALISSELLKHEDVTKYTTVWMDTLRDGKFGLSNTNKLIRFYKGANGIKTGSTAAAKYCLSASAKRDGMQLVCVVLGAQSTQDRFSHASKLLDYGFKNYSVITPGNQNEDRVYLIGGKNDYLETETKNMGNIVVKKEDKEKVKIEKNIIKEVKAPVKKGEKLGEIIYSLDGKEIAKNDIIARVDGNKMNLFEVYLKMIKRWLSI